MRISDKVLELIRTTRRLRNRLAYELNVHPGTVSRWISENDDNLTKAAAMQIIREELGIEDHEILESVPVDHN